MKDRLITLLGASLALYLVIVLFLPREVEDKNTSRPTSEDSGGNGFKGLKQWLDNADIKTWSLRQRYQHLSVTPELNNSGNLLIISIPQRIPTQHKERKALTRWLEQGNSILLLTDDALTFYFDMELLEELGIDFGRTVNSDGNECGNTTDRQEKLTELEKIFDIEPLVSEYFPVGKHPVFDRVNFIKSKTELFTHNDAIAKEPHLLVALAREKQTGYASFWLLQRPCCKIWLFNHAGIFDNEALGYADNARLFSNILNLSLTKNGGVIFDDMHQGLSVLYDPEAFFRDPRLYKTILFMLMLWLFYIIGYTNRFGPVSMPKNISNSLGFVKATGVLFSRNLNDKDIAKRLLEHFNNEYRSKRGMQINGAPVWENLYSNPAVDKSTLATLQTRYADLDAGEKIDLMTTFNLIQKIRGLL